MCPKKSEFKTKSNTAIEGDQFTEQDKSINVLNLHSHMTGVTVLSVMAAIIILFVMYILYKKCQTSMQARAERRRIERANAANFSVEDLIADIQERREARAPGL